MTIFLTGGTGFIGRNLLPLLVEAGHRIILYVREGSRTDFLERYSAWECAPYRKEDGQMHDIFLEERVELIIHLATDYVKRHDDEDLQRMLSANIEFPTCMLQSAVKAKVPFFINTGTFFEYDLGKTEPIDETRPLSPYNLYAATKVAFERLLMYYTANHAMKALTLKLFAPYGPEDKVQKVIPKIIDATIQEKALKLHSSGLQRWDYVFSDDVARAFCASVRYLSANPQESILTLNIGSGKAHSLRDIANEVEGIIGKPMSVEWGEDSYDEIRYACADTTRAKKTLGWHPQVSLKEGLNKTIDWYRKELSQKREVTE